MRRSVEVRLFAVLAIAVIMSWCASAYPTTADGMVSQLNAGNMCNGQATYYGWGADNTGTCSFWASGAGNFPWLTNLKGSNNGLYNNVAFGVSLNSVQFDNSASCGMCIKFRGKGTGNGAQGDKPPTSWNYAIVNSLCPECKACDIDIPQGRDGRWEIEWYPVPCPVGNSPLYYHHVGSHVSYLKLQVSNHKYPVSKLEVKVGGQWRTGNRVHDNYFLIPGSGFTNNMGVRVTAVTGAVVEDVIQPTLAGTWVGTGLYGRQFDSGSGYSGRRTGARAVRRKPRKTNRRNKRKRKSSAKKCQFWLKKGWQCGGKGGYCKGSNCKDRVWTGACCSRSKCVRRNSKSWTCK